MNAIINKPYRICLTLAAIVSGKPRNLKTSGKIFTTNAAPATGPVMLPVPPIKTADRIKMDSSMVNELGSIYDTWVA